MIDLFLLLELCTEEKGNYSLEFNPHKSYYQKPEELLAERYESDEYKNIDLTKDIYILQWYQHTPIGFYTIIENDTKSIVNRILGILEVPKCFLTAGGDSIYFKGKYILVHPQHEPIVIAKGGIIEPVITIDASPKKVAAMQKVLNGRKVFGNWVNNEEETKS